MRVRSLIFSRWFAPSFSFTGRCSGLVEIRSRTANPGPILLGWRCHRQVCKFVTSTLFTRSKFLFQLQNGRSKAENYSRISDINIQNIVLREPPCPGKPPWLVRTICDKRREKNLGARAAKRSKPERQPFSQLQLRSLIAPERTKPSRISELRPSVSRRPGKT